MMTQQEFNQIRDDIKKSVDDIFKEACNNSHNDDYKLFLLMVFDKNKPKSYLEEYKNNENHYYNLLRNYFPYNPNCNTINSTDIYNIISKFDRRAILFEIHIYTSFLEIRSMLHILYFLSYLAKNKAYKLDFNLLQKRNYYTKRIINNIKQKLSPNPTIISVISKFFNSELRNSFAHSLFYLETSQSNVNKIAYFNNNTLNQIPIKDWKINIIKCILFYEEVRNKFKEELLSLKNDIQTQQISSIKINNQIYKIVLSSNANNISFSLN